MGAHDHYKRADLFLVRLWTKEARDGSSTIEWRGKVQRIVDGESRQFSSPQGLVDSLQAMLSNNERR